MNLKGPRTIADLIQASFPFAQKMRRNLCSQYLPAARASYPQAAAMQRVAQTKFDSHEYLPCRRGI